MSSESMPLAAGYLAATIRASPVSDRCNVTILNFSGRNGPFEMALTLAKLGRADLVAFSVLGWNYRQFCAVAETAKQLNPSALVVFGGSHVSHQGHRVLSEVGAVDVVVNGEGEATFLELVERWIGGGSLSDVSGVTFRKSRNEFETTAARSPIADLDLIPSPILTGAIPLVGGSGEFRYDVALMETNRGCPYQCGFCYWGGAVGQRVRSFSRERLRAELWALARARAETVVLCDANFGMQRRDEEFVSDLIEVRRETGFPKALETSWAKNKSRVFYDIVGMMREEGLQTSFTLALQSLNEAALEVMGRKNMRINEWKDLASWLEKQGMHSYAELIWGAPGETSESFLRGYDELARHVSRIAAYPLVLLPNTNFSDRREHYGFLTVRGDRDDFEYVLGSAGVGVDEHLSMQRFLFWARLLAENLIFRNIFPLLRVAAGMEQSQVVISFMKFVSAQRSPLAVELLAAASGSIADPDSLGPALASCFTSSDFDGLVERWWGEALREEVPDLWRRCIAEAIKFDLLTRPLPDPVGRGLADARYLTHDDLPYWVVVREFEHDIPRCATAARAGRLEGPPAPQRRSLEIAFRGGFAPLAASTNHEEAAHYVGRVWRDSMDLQLRQSS